MYKIIYLPTGEEVIKPTNIRGNVMTIKAARRYLKSDKSYAVRYREEEIYFTTEPEFRDNHPNYNADFCKKMGRSKIEKYHLSIVRIKDA